MTNAVIANAISFFLHKYSPLLLWNLYTVRKHLRRAGQGKVKGEVAVKQTKIQVRDGEAGK